MLKIERYREINREKIKLYILYYVLVIVFYYNIVIGS